jgi:NOL1/NOP2/fmu family ribosome biogenesis protein
LKPELNFKTSLIAPVNSYASEKNSSRNGILLAEMSKKKYVKKIFLKIKKIEKT